MVSTIVKVNGHNVVIVSSVKTYDIFVGENGGVSKEPIISVMGLDNAIASITAIIDSDKRLSPSAAFLIRERPE